MTVFEYIPFMKLALRLNRSSNNCLALPKIRCIMHFGTELPLSENLEEGIQFLIPQSENNLLSISPKTKLHDAKGGYQFYQL
jgi:hypothetical protein